MSYQIRFSRQAEKDFELIKKSPLKTKAFAILTILKTDPFQPQFEELKENLRGNYSRRLNKQHRIVYKINEKEKQITILRMWTHYEKL